MKQNMYTLSGVDTYFQVDFVPFDKNFDRYSIHPVVVEISDLNSYPDLSRMAKEGYLS